MEIADVKEFLRLDGNADDNALQIIIDACTKRVESLIDQKLIEQTWAIYFDAFPGTPVDDWWDGVRQGSITELISPCKNLELPFGPLSEVEVFNTYGDDNQAVEFENINFYADNISNVPTISLLSGSVWPATILRPKNGIEIIAKFGYSDDADDIPQDLKQGLMAFIAYCYEHRGDENPKIPANAMLFFEPYRRFKVGR